MFGDKHQPTGPVQIVDPTAQNLLTSILGELKEQQSFKTATKPELVVINTAGYQFSAQGFRRSVLYAQASGALTVTVAGFSYNQSVQVGPNQMDFPDNSVITSATPLTGYLIRENHSRYSTKPSIFVNVKDYGAVGNGITDDTTAIQNAVNAALSATGGRLYFPNGTYKITSSINIPFADGFIIEGQSRLGSIIKQYTDNTPIFRFTTALTHSWLIRELSFTYQNSQPSTNTLAVAIYFDLLSGIGGNGYFNCQIERCTFNAGYYGIMQTQAASTQVSVWAISIRDCVFGGSLAGGIFLAPNPAIGVPEVNIENCHFDCQNMVKDVIHVTNCDTLFLKSIEFNNGAYGSNTAAAGSSQISASTCLNVTVMNCRSENVTINNAGIFALWHFAQSSAVLIGCEWTSVTVTAGNAVMAYADTSGTIEAHSLQGGGNITSGSMSFLYASKITLLSGVVAPAPITRMYTTSAVPLVDVDLMQAQNTHGTIGDANTALTATSAKLQYINTVFTANRTITLPNSGVYDGMEFTIVKWVTDAFTTTVTDPLSGKNITTTAGQPFCIRYRAVSGAEWLPIEYSIL